MGKLVMMDRAMKVMNSCRICRKIGQLQGMSVERDENAGVEMEHPGEDF